MTRKKIIFTAAAVIVSALLSLTAWRLVLHIRYPYHFEFARELSISVTELEKNFGERNERNERIFGMAVESSKENWSRVSEMAQEDDKTILGTYFYNLANAMTGHLSERLMKHYQPFGYGLFIPVDEETPILDIICSDEVWYQLGEMTMAEHNAILGMIFSPKHEGPRFFRRLAEINLVNGDTSAAEKYIRLLGHPVPEDWKGKTPLVQKKDIVHGASQVRPVLKGLVESCPENMPAYEYLLCYDLLIKDISAFVEDYMPVRKQCRLYQEAALIYMASNDMMTQDHLDYFGITENVLKDFVSYTEIYNETRGSARHLESSFHSSYWFFYHFAKVNEKGKRI